MPDQAFVVVPRAEWGAKHGRGNPTSGGKRLAVVHNDSIAAPSRSRPGMSVEDESKIMRVYEDFHARTLTPTNPRIGYNFVVMQTGRIYEGCGWGRVGAHVANMNSKAVGWCFAINGAATDPAQDAINAFRWHISEGVRLGHLTPDVEIKGHQDFGKPSCPGVKLYDAAVRKYVPWSARPDTPPSTSKVGTIVHSDFLGEPVIVTRYVADDDWRFVRVRDLPEGVKATAKLSQMRRVS